MLFGEFWFGNRVPFASWMEIAVPLTIHIIVHSLKCCHKSIETWDFLHSLPPRNSKAPLPAPEVVPGRRPVLFLDKRSFAALIPVIPMMLPLRRGLAEIGCIRLLTPGEILFGGFLK